MSPFTSTPFFLAHLHCCIHQRAPGVPGVACSMVKHSSANVPEPPSNPNPPDPSPQGTFLGSCLRLWGWSVEQSSPCWPSIVLSITCERWCLFGAGLSSAAVFGSEGSAGECWVSSLLCSHCSLFLILHSPAQAMLPSRDHLGCVNVLTAHSRAH